MASTLHLQQTSRWTVDCLHSAIRAIERVDVTDHALALRAATKAASPRQTLAEMRAMYLASPDSRR